VLLVYYLNFRYGYSMYLEEAPSLAAHEVRERDYFFIIGFQLWGIYAGLGLAALWGRWTAPPRRSSPRAAAAHDRGPPPAGFGPRHRKGAALLALGLIPFFFNFGQADRSGDRAARNLAYNMLQSVEPYAVLFTYGDNDTFPLWYLQEVEGIRRDVTVIVQSYLGTNWYHRQLRRLTKPCEPGESPEDSPTTVGCQRPFDPATAADLYAEMPAARPTRSAIPPADTGIDARSRGQLIPEDSSYRLSDRIAGPLREGDVFSPAELRVLQIARQSLGDRPIYFAATATPVYGKWGLQPHLVRQGLAFKLVDGPLEASRTLVDLGEFLRDLGRPTWHDRARTGELLEHVFLVDDILAWNEWPDPSTRSNIPVEYYLAHVSHGMSEELHGDPNAAERAYRRANHFARLAGLAPASD